MSGGQIWLLLFAGVLSASTVASYALSGRANWLGCISVPVTSSVAMTGYVMVFDPDPQAPIFLVMFYILAVVAGALGFVIGRVMARGGR